MYFCEFLGRLKRCNRDLFVDEGSAVQRDAEWSLIGLYVRRHEQRAAFSLAEKMTLDGDARQYVDSLDSGNRSEHLCSIPRNWVPEHDVFDPHKGRLLARGWRSILQTLIQKRTITLGRARDVFGSSVGDNAYERMNFDQRLQDAKDQAGVFSARELLARKGIRI